MKIVNLRKFENSPASLRMLKIKKVYADFVDQCSHTYASLLNI